MKKNLIVIAMSILLLSSCNNKKEDTNESYEDVTYDEDNYCRKEKINKDNLKYYFDYDYSISENIITINLNPYKKGFVSYEGYVSYSLSYSYNCYNPETYNYDPTNVTKTIKIDLNTIDCEFKYVENITDNWYENPNNVNIKFVDANILASYHYEGISGDKSLMVKSYEITPYNYSYYFVISKNTKLIDEQYVSFYEMKPNQIAGQDLMDFRIIVTYKTSDGEATDYTCRDGSFTFPVGASSSLVDIKGYIDVYPTSVI